jgi:hypothetical protein
MANQCIAKMGTMVLIVVWCVGLLLAAGCGKPGAAGVAERMVDSMAKGDFASATRGFDPTMKSVMSAERLGQTWSKLTDQAGRFKARVRTREAQEAGFRAAYVTCQFEKTSLDTKVVLDGPGQIRGLWFVPTK